ncbi:MAG: glutamine amidotransferase [Kiritimatiellae bacterium]|nr:glutamine amidotransferase [Kiritimatiellia bacterium]
MRCILIQRMIGTILIMAAMLVVTGWSKGIDVISMGSQKEGEIRYYFKGGAFPYVLRLWEHRAKGSNDVSEVKTRGLGLRGPWFENLNFGNAWYINDFIQIHINGKNILGDKAYLKSSMVDGTEMYESGNRALVEFMWERDVATIRLRFMMIKGIRALMAELKIEPKQKIETISVNGSVFPDGYTAITKTKGDRRVRTLSREVMQDQTVILDTAKEPWVLFYDELLGNARKLNAGLYLIPDGITNVQVKTTDYPIYITIKAKPEAVRLRMAFDELGFSNLESFQVMSDAWPAIEQRLKTDSFAPSVLDQFDEKAETKKVSAVAVALPERKTIIKQLLKQIEDTQRQFDQFKADTSLQTIPAEQKMLEAISGCRRKALTLERYARKQMKLLQLRGPAYSIYRLNEAVNRKGEQDVEIKGGYLFLGGQGRNVSYFPPSADDLYQYDAILLMDIDTRALGSQSIGMIRQYVEDGGGLLVFGGWFSYAAGNIKDTPLYDLLPYRIETSPFGLRQAKPSEILKIVNHKTWLKGFVVDEKVVSPWYHELIPAKDAELLVTVGEKPWLATRSYGAGRVAACAGTVLGQSANEQVTFFEWKKWPKLLKMMIEWSAQKTVPGNPS